MARHRSLIRARRADFVTSAAGPEGFPPARDPEIAVAGRSNVGKSSFLNALTGASSLARTSSTPGRTRLLNWFRVEHDMAGTLCFVDLPGYGFAKVPLEIRESWRPLVESYLGARKTLRGVILLIDLRRGAEGEERDLLEWLTSVGIAVQVVVTKADKLPKAKRQVAALGLKRELGLRHDPVLCSATTGEGLENAWRAVIRLISSRTDGTPV